MANKSSRGRPPGSPNKSTIRIADIGVIQSGVEKAIKENTNEKGEFNKVSFIAKFKNDPFALANALDYISVEDMLINFGKEKELFDAYKKYQLLQKSKFLVQGDVSVKEKLFKEAGIATSIKEEGIKIEFNFDKKVLDLIENDLDKEVRNVEELKMVSEVE